MGTNLRLILLWKLEPIFLPPPLPIQKTKKNKIKSRLSLSLAENFQIRMSQGNNTFLSLLLFEIFFNFLGTHLFHSNVVSFCDMHIWVLWRNMIKVLISCQSFFFIQIEFDGSRLFLILFITHVSKLNI